MDISVCNFEEMLLRLVDGCLSYTPHPPNRLRACRKSNASETLCDLGVLICISYVRYYSMVLLDDGVYLKGRENEGAMTARLWLETSDDFKKAS